MDLYDNTVLGMRMWARGRTTSLLLKPGLTVLYGRNGAGKSTILGSVQSVLSGLAGRFPAELHLPASANAAWHDLLVSWQHSGLHCENMDGLAEAVSAANTRLAVVPVGRTRAQWEVWLTIDPSQECFAPWMDPLSGLAGEFTQIWNAIEHEQDQLRAEDLVDDLSERSWACAAHPLLAGSKSIFGKSPEHEGRIEIAVIEDFLSIWPVTGIPTQPRDGLPVPVMRLTEPNFRGNGLWEVGDSELNEELHLAVRELVAVERSAQDRALTPTTGEDLFGDITEQSQHISERARAAFARLLPEPPNLSIDVKHLAEWPYGPAMQWGINNPWDIWPRRRGLSDLSAGEQRWARISARLATAEAANAWKRRNQEEVSLPEVLLIDEPEAHLHRSAERHMAEGLRSLIPSTIEYAVVATHSPHLLDVPDAHLYWVKEGEAHPFGGADLDRLESLGMLPSDLLGITRTILLVEGKHDEWVLEASIGDRLRITNTRIVPLHGGKGLASVVDSQVLFHFTQARVVGLLDNISAAQVTQVWDHALVLAAEESVAAATKYIRTALPGKVDGKTLSENVYMKQWFQEAIAAPDSFPRSRMAPFGLEKPDILEYLPVQAFVPTVSSWDELRREWQSRIESGKATGVLEKNFKAWITSVYGVNFDDENLIRIAASEIEPPEEFLRLAEVCKSVGHDPIESTGL